MIDFDENSTSIAQPSTGQKAEPTASFALCFFESDASIEGVTFHKVNDNKIQMGKYIDKDEALNFVKRISSKDSSTPQSAWNSEDILIDTNRTLVFYRRSFKNRMWFRMPQGHFALNVPYPTLLYKVDRLTRNLNVWALDKDSRPTLDSKLYHAPLMNIDSNGELCQGTAPIPSELNNACRDKIVSALIDSNFSHVNHRNTLKIKDESSINNDIFVKFYKGLETEVDFPNSNLAPTNQSIAELIKKV